MEQNMYDLNYLYKKLEEISYEDFYIIEADFFLHLYDIPYEKRIPCVKAFLIISSWFGTSQRSGVWTFYEATNQEEIADVVQYLKFQEENEMADILKKGMHDYHNPIYAETFDYPNEWIEESTLIDEWIWGHKDKLWNWLYCLLFNNKELIMNSE